MKHGVFFLINMFAICLLSVGQFGPIDHKINQTRLKINSDPLQAMRELESLASDCRDLRYNKGLAECYNLQGIILFNRGHNDVALQSFVNSLKYFRMINDTNGISKTYNNLGVVSFTIKKYYYSIFFFNQSLLIQQRYQNYRNIIDLKNNLGSLYEKLQRYDTAMALHREANEIARQQNYVVGLASGLNNIGVIFENTGQADSAVFYYSGSLFYKDSLPSQQKALTYSNLARTLMNDGKLNDVLAFLDSSLNYALKSEALDKLPEIYSLYSTYYEKKGDHAKAYEYLKKYKVTSLEIENQTTEGDFANFILSMQQDRWEQERNMLDREVKLKNRLQWMLIIVIVIVVLVFVLAYIAIRNRNRILDQRNALAESESKRLSEELDSKAKIAQLEREHLTNELKMKERQLTTMTMHIVTKNETLQEIEKHLMSFATTHRDIANDAVIKKIQGIIRMNAGDEVVWSNYFYHFEQVYPGFFKVLAESHPDLTQGEQKLCAYILINLSNKEIAHVMGISEASIKIKKNRLSKKLKLDIASDLTAYLQRFATRQ